MDIPETGPIILWSLSGFRNIGDVTYMLKLPSTLKVYLVFHVSQLKKAIGSYSVETDLPADLEVELDESGEPEKVLASLEVVKAGRNGKQWLVQWRARLWKMQHGRMNLYLANFLISALRTRLFFQQLAVIGY